jgi:hypothetical protein
MRIARCQTGCQIDVQGFTAIAGRWIDGVDQFDVVCRETGLLG